jgi:hypothetical protein
MKRLVEEVEQNFKKFCRSYKTEAQDTAAKLETYQAKYLESYRRMVSLQAWRSELLENTISAESLSFFLEAQNDALTSHVLASFGAWRSSLKSLRSCIENILFCIYYKDHPVELELWHSGQHKLTFTAVEKYLAAHPALDGISPSVSGITLLSGEYSTLSKAVHASAKGFRMSVEGIGVQLWSNDPARLGAWGTREAKVLTGVNELLMTLFREQLQGGRLSNLRKAISLVIPTSHHTEIKNRLGITLFKP